MTDRAQAAWSDDRLPTVSPASETDRLSLLIYGKPGVGKTVLAATAEDDPRSAPVLFCDVEGGTLSISHRGRALRVFPIKDFRSDMNTLVEYFHGPNGIRGDIPYKTLVIDSLTDLANRAMDSVLATPNNKRSTPGVPEFTDWNVFTNRMKSLLTFLNDLPLNVIVTALESDEDGSVMPMFPGKKVGPSLPGKFNTVGRLYVAQVVGTEGKTSYRRRLLMQADVRYMAKDRADKLGTLPREMDEPTVTKLLDRMAEGKRLATAQLKLLKQQEEK